MHAATYLLMLASISQCRIFIVFKFEEKWSIANFNIPNECVI